MTKDIEPVLERVISTLEREVQRDDDIDIHVIRKPKSGAQAAHAGDLVRVHYTGTLLDGTVFDSSIKRKKPFEFRLDRGQVIRGWDMALSRMRVGEWARVTIPPQYAYGARGKGPIPPNATLVFEIRFLAILR
jgi:FKBP-type peptidyl-prolyl cis-trans isomerase